MGSQFFIPTAFHPFLTSCFTASSQRSFDPTNISSCRLTTIAKYFPCSYPSIHFLHPASHHPPNDALTRPTFLVVETMIWLIYFPCSYLHVIGKAVWRKWKRRYMVLVQVSQYTFALCSYKDKKSEPAEMMQLDGFTVDYIELASGEINSCKSIDWIGKHFTVNLALKNIKTGKRGSEMNSFLLLFLSQQKPISNLNIRLKVYLQNLK